MLEEADGDRRALSDVTCNTMAKCKEGLLGDLGDLEGALASAREVHRIFSKLGTSHAGQAHNAAAMVQRLGGRV
jgi:hypothetical protein